MIFRCMFFLFFVLQICLIDASIELMHSNDNLAQDTFFSGADKRKSLFVHLYEHIKLENIDGLQELLKNEEYIDDIAMLIMTIAVLLNKSEIINLLVQEIDLAFWPFMSESNLLINLDLMHPKNSKMRREISALYDHFFNTLTIEKFGYFFQEGCLSLALEEDDNHFLQLLLDYDRIDLVYAYITDHYTKFQENWDADDQHVVTILLSYYKDTARYKAVTINAIEYLLSLGFDSNARNECSSAIGRYISWAVQNNLIPIVHLLIAYGTPIDQVEDSYDHDNCIEIEEILGLTPIEIAHKYNHADLVKLLS